MALNDTVSSSLANSYVSRAFAHAYFTDHLLGDSWLEFSKQDASLVQATLLLDSLVTWIGVVATSEQALEWPRILESGDFDGVIPPRIQKATCELALYLAETGSTIQDNSISDIHVGPIKIKMNSDNAVTLLPDLIAGIIRELGSTKASPGNSVTTITLLRA